MKKIRSHCVWCNNNTVDIIEFGHVFCAECNKLKRKQEQPSQAAEEGK